MQRAEHQSLYDIDLQTGATIEVFYADRTLETFGRCGAGWFWWSRRRGFSPVGPATGPFSTPYAAYLNAMTTTGVLLEDEPQSLSALPRRYWTGV